MNDTWIERWNDRYSKDEYAYGEQPNNFLREELEKLKPGAILFPPRVKDVMQFLLLNWIGMFLPLTSAPKEKIKPFAWQEQIK